MKKLIVFMFSIVLMGSCAKKGCTDPYSLNYDAVATEDNGTCDDVREITLSFSLDSTGWEWIGGDITISHNSFSGGVLTVTNIPGYSPEWQGQPGFYIPETSITFTMNKSENIQMAAIAYCEETLLVSGYVNHYFKVDAEINGSVFELQQWKQVDGSTTTYWVVP